MVQLKNLFCLVNLSLCDFHDLTCSSTTTSQVEIVSTDIGDYIVFLLFRIPVFKNNRRGIYLRRFKQLAKKNFEILVHKIIKIYKKRKSIFQD